MRLPVEPERLRREFPTLSDEDLAAYEAVTRELLAHPSSRGRRLAAVLAAVDRAREKAAAGIALEEEERQALAYARALAKMRGRRTG